jgi:DNA-binding NarL/FixJ family response regulator
MPVKIMITDDHHLLVHGISDMLSALKDMVVVKTFSSGSELMEGLRKQQPDVLILDVQLKDNRDSQLARKVLLHYPQVRILMLSGIESISLVRELIQAGCLGYLLKSSATRDMLVEAVLEVSRKKIFIDPALKDQLLTDVFTGHTSGPEEKQILTRREKQILELIVAEFTTAEIAQQLFLSIRTVENHRFNIAQKLGVKNTAGLMKKAIQLGLIES